MISWAKEFFFLGVALGLNVGFFGFTATVVLGTIAAWVVGAYFWPFKKTV